MVKIFVSCSHGSNALCTFWKARLHEWAFLFISFYVRMWRSYLWHMNFFPSTSRVTSHSCWASRSCFNPKTHRTVGWMSKNLTEQKGAGINAKRRKRVGKTGHTNVTSFLSHHAWCSLPTVWCCHRGSPPPLSRCLTEVLLLPHLHPAMAGDARWLCPPARHSSERQCTNTDTHS